MELLPKDIREQLPELYANEEIGLAAQALVKFFTPDDGWTWYASEFNGENVFFGLVIGDVAEYCYTHVPKWNPMNVCSYHLQEAGATPVQELAYALATAIAVLDWAAVMTNASRR